MPVDARISAYDGMGTMNLTRQVAEQWGELPAAERIAVVESIVKLIYERGQPGCRGFALPACADLLSEAILRDFETATQGLPLAAE